METLDGTEWDVLISGTGIQQSLLALALSRCGKKVLHIDKNDVYGGAEAALSLDEAEQFANIVNSDNCRSPFSNASISRSEGGNTTHKLGSSRSYNLSLAPALLYTRSALLPVLVSSRAHQQLEFQAVGSWFVYGEVVSGEMHEPESDVVAKKPGLIRVPNGREDIFADKTLGLKAKGSLTKFLRFVAAYEEKPEEWQPCQDMSFSEFLSQRFSLPSVSHGPLMALTLSSKAAAETTTGFALPRIARHLRSIGMFGPGFGAVIPKWGGLSEVAQVACRAGAVGGGVYVLGKGIDTIEEGDVEEIARPELCQADISQEVSEAIGANNFVPVDEESLNTYESAIKEQSLEELLAAAGYSVDTPENDEAADETVTSAVEETPAEPPQPQRKFSVLLEDGEKIKADFIVGTIHDLPEGQDVTSILPTSSQATGLPDFATRSISVISAALPALFTPAAEGGVTPAGAVVVFPSGSLPGTSDLTPPVHVIAHTNDTGECPPGQTVLYASIALSGEDAFALLDKAVSSLVATQDAKIDVLWTLRYQQGSESLLSATPDTEANILRFSDPRPDISFNDEILDNVKAAWLKITGSTGDEFMKFEGRETGPDDDEQDDE